MRTVAIESIVIPESRRPAGPLEALCESIAAVGLLNPVTVTDKNVLVAGRNRVEACRRLGWREIPANVVTLDDLDREIATIDENLIRNELTVLERAEQLARRKQLYEARHPETKAGGDRRSPDAKSKRNNFVLIPTVTCSEPAPASESHEPAVSKRVGTPSPSFAADTAAKTNVTPRTVQQEVKIAKSIPADVRDQIRATPVADSKTDLLKIARMPEFEQRAVAQKIAAGEARDVKEAKKVIDRAKREEAAAKVANLQIDDFRLGDFRDVAKSIDDNSLDLIFTDPPYDRESLPLYGDLARIAAQKLKEGGSLICYLGQYQIDKVISLVTPHLRLWWTLAVAMPTGPAARMTEYGVLVKWKPLLWFVRGTRGDKHTFVEDLVASPREKDCHEWQQSVIEAKYYIEKLAPKGGLVFDPFCGGGTTAVACRSIGVRCITCDTDQVALALAKKRFAEGLEARA